MKGPARLKTKAGHRPRARVHATWSPIGQKVRRAGLIRLLGVLLGLLMVGGLTADAYAQSFLAGLPTISGLDAANFGSDVFISDRNGVQLADVAAQGDRKIYVQLKDVSPKMREATIAIEDKSFYSNSGFDLQGIARAAISNFHSKTITGGGSTITQQLAKRLFLTPDQTYQRKAQEVVLAYQLTQQYSKDQILELYLNRVYYGEQAYGVEAASKTFFHKPAKDLDLAQAAMLAGLPQAPSRWDPLLAPNSARARQQEVLAAMVRQGYITEADSQAAAAEKVEVFGPVNTFLAPHFVKYVQDELETLGFKIGSQQLFVKTTLDYGKQQIGEQVVRQNVEDQKWRDPGGLLDSSVVSVDPRTGQILVMVGAGFDFNATGGQFNMTTTYINPGSSVKPFTYAAVINARKATMDTPIADNPSPLEVPQGAGQPPAKIYNYDRGTHGVMPLRMALANSLNIPAVKAELSIGVPAVVEYWRTLGLRPLDFFDNPDGSIYNYGASLTLGGAGITTLQEAMAYATIADLGVRHDPEAILEVRDAHNNVLYQANPDAHAHPVMDPGVAFIVASIMSDDNNRAQIFGRGGPLTFGSEHTVAAKTGTTESFHDALTIGYTPDIATVMWMGDILDIKHTLNQDAISVVAPAWHEYMARVLAGTPDRWYDPPVDVVKGPGNSWYLADSTRVDKLPNDNPTGTPTPVDYGIPPDPGGPLVVATPVPTPVPSPSQRPTPSPTR